MKFWISSILFIFLCTTQAQEIYFPADTLWESKSPEIFDLNLDAAINFARKNEYTGARDLEQAILKGFEPPNALKSVPRFSKYPFSKRLFAGKNRKWK